MAAVAALLALYPDAVEFYLAAQGGHGVEEAAAGGGGDAVTFVDEVLRRLGDALDPDDHECVPDDLAASPLAS